MTAETIPEREDLNNMMLLDDLNLINELWDQAFKRSLLYAIGLKLQTIPVIYCYNIHATYLYANPIFHTSMKHIALDYHFVRSQIQVGALRVAHV